MTDKRPDYPFGAREFFRTGDLEGAALLISVLVDEFTDRPDLTDVERAACRVAHGAVQKACGDVWQRAYDQRKIIEKTLSDTIARDVANAATFTEITG